MRALVGPWVMELLVALLSAGAATATVVLAERAGVSSRKSTIALSVAGAAGLVLGRGTARAVSAGVLAASVGQLLSGWFAQLDKRIAAGSEPRARDDRARGLRQPGADSATLEAV